MPSSAALLITAVVAFATMSSTYATKGFIFTAPRSMEKNAVNKLHLSLYEVNDPGIMTITLKNTESNETIAEKVVGIEEGENEKVIEMKIPDTSDYMAHMWVNGTFGDSGDYDFAEQEEVYFHPTYNKVCFIQTDKPLYKPGQQVKFRCLVLDRELRPLKEVPASIWIEDNEGSRLAQWKNISLAGGIRQFEFLLSEDPPLGVYKITVEMPDMTETMGVEVQEYVLPKYEVAIKTPPYVLADAEIIPLEICAKYTYGKPVQGLMKVNTSLESYSWSNDKFPVYEIEDEINGCYKYDMNVSLVDTEFNYVYRRIEVIAQVTEEGTGVVRNGTVKIERTYEALKLTFPEDDRQNFKPGIPYRRKVKATKPDNTPAAGEEVEISAIISRQRVLDHWWATRKVKYSRNYTTDEAGIVVFQVPPQKTDAISFQLEAKATKYGSAPTIPGRPRIYQPQTSMSVQPYYSPSKSSMQVENSDETLECGTTQNVKVLYTAEEGAMYTFHYQVISKGEVVKKGSKEVTFASDDDVGACACKDSLSVNDVRTTLVPTIPEGENTTDEDIDCNSGPIGTVEIPIEVDAKLSPSFRLLVYYIREDDETVADSSMFQVQKCFQNKVEFRFADEERQPGATTSYKLKASPNSMCGTKVVDKSITLLDSSDQLTKEKVFEALKRFDNQQHYRRNHCNDKYRKGGKNKMEQTMILPPRPWSSSQYADALTAFEDTGFAVMSDLNLLNRPCSRGEGTSYDSYGGGGGYGGSMALASVGVRGGQGQLLRRPMATTPTRHTKAKSRPVPAAAQFEHSGADRDDTAKVGSSTTAKSVVDIRTEFPETWLFDMESVGESGEVISKATLPHTITEWVGNAVCVNEDDGLGLSDTTSIRGLQDFFIAMNLPYSVIRKEKVPLIVSIFNYLPKCISITRTISLVVFSYNGTVVQELSTSEDVCVCGEKTNTFKYMFTPEHVGTVNLTVNAESAGTSSVCGDKETTDVVARDKMTQSLESEAEGFPQENVATILFCPDDYDESTYVGNFPVSFPSNAVDGSERCYASLSGDIMGPAIEGLDGLVRLPTGCGEQNLVLFVPNFLVLNYLTATGKLTESMKNKAIKNLQTGYQRQLKYRHPDGSYSAFGVSDKVGSMFLSAFVLMSFSRAKEYIPIDEQDLSRTEKWIVGKQQDDGCFPQVGKVFSEAMKGGVGSQGKTSNGPLTAYVATSLITAKYQNETVISNALSCIKKDEDLKPYTAALYAYCTALAKDDEADRYLEWLNQRAIKQGDETYWKNVNGTKSLDLETCAYTVLAILHRKGDDGLSQALSIVRHMTKMRNSNGGFHSTQDTVVGLQAIALFAEKISHDPVDLTVTLEGGNLKKTLQINEDNKLLVNKFRVPVVPTNLGITARGAGCGLFQVSVKYNTLQVQKEKFFSISIDAKRYSEECKRVKITFCTSYLPEDKSSNMAILEIKMVSGFVAVKESLDQLVQKDEGILKRYEIKNNNVVLYFEELSNNSTCGEFDVEEYSAVEESKPATTKVYDYYAEEKKESTDYNISGSC